jgi:hypothetical protein
MFYGEKFLELSIWHRIWLLGANLSKIILLLLLFSFALSFPTFGRHCETKITLGFVEDVRSYAKRFVDPFFEVF